MTTSISSGTQTVADDAQLTAAWLSFAESANTTDFCWSWLFLQCQAISDTRSGMVLLGAPGTGPYSPVAAWPNSARDLQHLVPAAESALGGRQGTVSLYSPPEAPEQQHYHIAYPLDVSGKLYGVVVLEVADRSDLDLQTAMRQLHWGMAWLETMLRRQEESEDREMIRRLAGALELATTVVQPGSFQKVAMELVNALASRLHCQRVSLGHCQKDFVHLVAISHTAQFDSKTNLAQAIEAAMEEALDQQQAILYPAPAGDTAVTRLHEELSVRFDGTAVFTILLPGREATFGAITLERPMASPFSDSDLELCKAVAHLLGPMLDMHRSNDRWFGARLMDSLQRQLEKVLGPRNLVLKSLIILASVALVLVCLIRVEYRVSAKTVLEGSVQRVVAAPFDGFLMHADKRPGDLVAANDVLCRLDDRDLQLERLKWASEAEQYQRKYQESMANHDRAEARIAEAQIKQARAEMSLLDEKLNKAKVVAPFDGILVSGDLSQKLGMPVRQGDELFKLAPMDRYRVILQVDEREIAYVKNNSQGTLILSGLPQDKLTFTVKRLTPVSTAEGGRNYFRVEASLQGDQNDHLRPGMEGVGKIDSGKRSLAWIWTHGVIHWFRLWIWSWWL